MHIMSDDDDAEEEDENDDRYCVLEASSTSVSGQEKVTPAGNDDKIMVSNDPSGIAASTSAADGDGDDDEANQLEDWLDQTMLQQQGEQPPPAKLTGRIAKKSKIPPQTYKNKTNSVQDQTNPYSSHHPQEQQQDKIRSSPRRRQPQSKQRQRPDPEEERRRQPIAPSIAATMSSITPTSTIDEYEGEDETYYDDDGASHNVVLEGSYDVYSVDSHGKVFDDSDDDDDDDDAKNDNDKGRESQQRRSKNKSKATSSKINSSKAAAAAQQQQQQWIRKMQ